MAAAILKPWQRTMRRFLIGLMSTGMLITVSGASAQDLGDRVKQFMGSMNGDNGGTAARQLPESEVVSGLKSALADGASAAVTQLGQNDGFWGNSARRIPLPGWMDNAAGMLKSAGYGDQMQSLQLAMNRAAEQATAEAGPIVREAINDMSVRDGYRILQGSDTAATEYLRDHTGEALAAKFEPIIENTTAQSEAVSAYESLTRQAKPMLSFVPGLNLDVNDYVTREALDGLFAVIGQQEKEIRENPAARGTDLLKKVFGNAGN